MKTAVLYLSVLGCALALPNGYYHQEYNYKTSASSYKNNELQHKTDDQGYYRKDGDLEGRVKPRIDSNSEHSEYVNPNLRTGQYIGTGGYGGLNTDLSSYGNVRAENAYGGYGTNLNADGIAQTDHITGRRGAYSATSGAYGSNSYGSNTYGTGSYGTSSNLRLITSRIQQELERDLPNIIRQNNAYSQSRVDISELERELRRNLTERIEKEISNRYGQQGIRGGMSYTLADGRLQTTANFDNQELTDLRRQLESNLLNQLRTEYNRYSTSSNSRYETQQSYNYGYTSTTIRPIYHTIYPSLPTYRTTVRPYYPVNTHANYQVIDTNSRYTPVSNPESITNIASTVQSQMDNRLNELLDEVYRKYFSSSSSYSLTNTDVVLERLKNELRSNLTYLIDENIRRNYGTQIQRDGYMYSVGSGGQSSTGYNYALRDLENLKSQIESNLIGKLTRDFETYKTRWSSQHSFSASSNYGSYSSSTPRYDYYSTPRYEVYNVPRYETYTTPSSYVSYPGSLTNGGTSSSLNYVSGSRQSGYEIQGRNSMAQLQRQLQDELSRKLQSAISSGHYSTYSTSGSYNPQSYQTSLQQLSDDLNRNLTRQLQEYSASGTYSAYGNFNSAQMESLRSQLQASLMRQLQQGLQQSYQTSSSYSASSSSSSGTNYRPVRGFSYQGQYKSGIETMGEDCGGDYTNAYSTRVKRSYQPYRSRAIGLGTIGLGRQHSYWDSRDTLGGYPYGRVQSQTEIGHQTDSSGLTQQTEISSSGKLHQGSHQTELEHQDLGQQIDDSDLTQQVEDTKYSNLQQIDDSDFNQQAEDSSFEKLQVHGHQTEVRPQPHNFNQHLVDVNYRKPSTIRNLITIDKLERGLQRVSGLLIDSNISQKTEGEVGQQIDDSDLNQQIEDSNYETWQQRTHQLEHGPQIDHSVDGKLHAPQQVVETGHQTQQEDTGYGKLQSNQEQVELGQNLEDADFTQHEQHIDISHPTQREDTRHGKLQSGQRQIQFGQNIENADLTQHEQHIDASHPTQREDTRHGKLQSSQRQIEFGQNIENADLTQHEQHIDDSHPTQYQDTGYGKLQSSQQQVEFGQNLENSDLTQHEQHIDTSHPTQREDTRHGKLQSSQQQIEFGQNIENADLTQHEQHIDASHPTQYQDTGYGKLQSSQQQVEFGQNLENSDLTQHEQQIDVSHSTQHEDRGYGKLQSGQQQIEFGQNLENADFIQHEQHIDASHPTQREDTGYGNLQPGQQQVEFGQNLENADLTQHEQHIDVSDTTQHEDTRYGKLQSGQQQIEFGQNLENSDLTQHEQHIDVSDTTQREDTGYEKLQSGQQIEPGQKIEDSGKLNRSPPQQIQQTEDLSYQKFQGQRQNSLEQNIDSSFTEQTEDSQYGQQVEHSGLFQNNNDLGHGKLQTDGQQIQQLDYSSVTQKVEKSPNSESLGSSGDIQQIENSGFENGVPSREFNSGISQKDKSVWSQDQLKMANMIKDGISKELKATVSSVYNVCRFGTGTCHLSTIYKDVEPDLKNHLREELEISMGNSVNINELRKLQDNLETDLKLLLQKEIENAQRSLRQNENLDFDQQEISEQQTLEQDNQEGRFREQPGKLEIGQHTQQETDTILHQPNTLIGSSTNPEIDLTHIDQSPIPRPQIPSGNLHTTSESVTQKSLTINEFLQQEIEHQERDLENQKTNEQSQPQLPSLKQVIDEQISDDGDDQRTEIPDALTGNKNLIPQNVGDDQLQELDGTNNEQNNNQEVIRGAPILSDQISSKYPSEGQSFGVTSQGQIVTQPQSKIDAENTADSLVSILREAQRNRQSQQEGNIPSNSHHHIPDYQEASNIQEGQGTYSYPGMNVFRGYGESTGIRRNDYGSHISQNTIDKQYNIYPDSNQESSSDYSRGQSGTYEHHRIRGSGHHHQHYGHSESRPFSNYGHQYIDENSEQGNSHRGSRPASNYGPQYTDESNVQQGYSHTRPRPSSTYGRQYMDENVQQGSSLSGSSPSSNYNHQYIEENVQTSNTRPHHPGLGNAVENSEPSRNINGVKGSYGRRGYHYNHILVTTEHPALTHKIQSQSEAISPPQPPHEAHIEPEIVSVTEENLPWWKKLGNTVKKGAQDLKSKIIGSN